jgi:hypothetical protein
MYFQVNHLMVLTLNQKTLLQRWLFIILHNNLSFVPTIWYASHCWRTWWQFLHLYHSILWWWNVIEHSVKQNEYSHLLWMICWWYTSIVHEHGAWKLCKSTSDLYQWCESTGLTTIYVLLFARCFFVFPALCGLIIWHTSRLRYFHIP